MRSPLSLDNVRVSGSTEWSELVDEVEAEWSAGAVSLTAPDNSHDEGHDEGTGPARWPCERPQFCVVRCTCCARTWERQVECADRSCKPCRRVRALKFGRRWDATLSRWRIGYFLTLTWPNLTHYPTKDDIDDARRRWRMFRRRMKGVLKGGWYALECTHTAHGYNLHIHALVLSGYDRPLEWVRKYWREVCPDSQWVHVSAVRSAAQAMRYLVGEIAKGSDVALPNGCRLVQRFGVVGGQPAPVLAVCPFCTSIGCIVVEIEAWEWSRIQGGS